MEYVYTPKACKADPATWSGTVTLKATTFDDACDMSEKLALAVAEVPEAIKDTRRIREAVKIASPMVLGVDLKRLRDGKEFKSWDDLKATIESNMLVEIATAAINGSEAGNG